MQTLTKRKERISRQLDDSDSLFFLLEVEPLFLEKREVVSFLGKEDQEKVRAFQSIASRYYPLVGRKLPKDCDCGGTIEQDNDHCVCDTCCKVSTAIENSNLLPNRVSNYDRKPKFRECMSRYQARQDVVNDKRPYEQYLSRYYGDFSKVTKKQIFSMLTKLGKEDQVKNIHLIHYEITGVPPNDIGYLEASLMCDFEVLKRLYDDTKGVVSVRQVLYHLLMKNDLACSKEEFGIKREDKMLNELFTQLGWQASLSIPKGPGWGAP